MSVGAGPLAIGRRAKEFAAEFAAALAQLAKAHDYAQDLRCDPWEFAVEIDRLLALGISTSDLRWLVEKGYIEHAREIIHSGDSARRFQPAPNLGFTRATCFTLTHSGLALARTKGGVNGHAAVRASPAASPAASPPIPQWDREGRVLYVGRGVVKEFRVRSPNQESVLAAFEEEGWPRYIDDPLSPSEQCPKHRLRDTIKGLNANQKNRLIRFRGDGTGERVRWELLAAVVPQGDSSIKFPGNLPTSASL
ncbi:MAG: hypothetical protein ABSG86_14565 [Thermoguttaceae bacterium]|jgi:hypothetical protein